MVWQAAKSMLGASFRITQERGKFIRDTRWAPLVTATYHPSAILRQPDDESRHRAMREFREDLRKVAQQLKQLRTHPVKPAPQAYHGETLWAGQ